MKMQQRQMAFYTACNLATAAGRTKHGIDRMRRLLEPLESLQSALEFFQERDDSAYAALITLRSHHLSGTTRGPGGEKRPKFDMSGADATWRIARTHFGMIAKGDQKVQFIDSDACRLIFGEMKKVLRAYAAGNHPKQRQEAS